ncbi:MAG: RnfABCDGE type electron transport complex subunit G [Bacteroidales bacterium]|nr:RnfABCDGE type electron transport complex subunit G [Bacteroidales bacterium]
MAKKAQSTLINMLVSLTVIAVVAAAALALVNSVTKEPIEIAKQEKTNAAIKAVLPDFDKLEDLTVDGNLCHVGYDADGNFVGAAVEAGSDAGFGGHLQLMVGFDKDGNVFGYQILETHETPGLGAKADLWFQKGSKGDIIGRTPTAENPLVVKKDGGDIDAISGSTITSRAFLGTVNTAAEVFAKMNI